MPATRYHAPIDDTTLVEGFETIRREVGVEPFSQDALREAEAAANRGPLLPPGTPDNGWTDMTGHYLVAIDPPGSLDLDQAFGAERTGTGYRVHYAIADVSAFVGPGTALAASALQRGVTLYSPDRRESLHPDVINEDAASLLPGAERPAVLWSIDLDESGELRSSTLVRSTVRVAEALTYREAQAEIDSGAPRECLLLLAEIGGLRQKLERDRGAVSLSLPSQEIRRDKHGHYELVYDHSLPVENWNAQISLLTGIAAARLMLDAGVGMLRTLPAPPSEIVAELRRTALGLGISWPDDQSYADRVRDLDPNDPQQAALLTRSASGLRGAGYTSFLNPGEIPSMIGHSAIAAPYAHVTAPLRRVCDRYVNEILLSIFSGLEPPPWALSALSELPSVMGRTRQRERALERAAVDYMDAMTLSSAVGNHFDAVVVNHRRDQAVILIREPAVIAPMGSKLDLGEEIRVELTAVDTVARTVSFARINP